MDESFDFDSGLHQMGNGDIDCFEILDDGKILIAFDYYDDGNDYFFEVFKLNSDGTIDNNFNVENFNYLISSIKVQQDGKIMVGGYFGDPIWGPFPYYGLARLNADGTLDNSFNPNNSEWKIKRVDDMIIQDSKGKLIVAANFELENGNRTNGVIRLNLNDGTVDSNFESYFFDSNIQRVNSMEAQPDNKFLVAGYFRIYNGHRKNFIARIFGDGEDLSVQDLNAHDLILYPNPTRDLIYFSKSPDEVKIFDLSGRLLKSIDKNTSQINIADLKSGIYVVKSKIEDKSVSHKIIKK